ncbi:TPR repeat protein [Anaeromyxobacter dehalogenans 2CP-1]|uniref:TPR repeat protein n=1 Tax=Anaeromyxobacter dehalogenans (strain ATCC BAA-258 / DSM 21875 / 2CP-1) TaxID=455488 RepID=B8JEF9_ANAD2|nr:MerR family transcriptional regulator [Anaeromyxobacter dehalogenans]ACL64285.1 TPR repeat protein [Anaeromyxobacter dehalogenans 2CP-1]
MWGYRTRDVARMLGLPPAEVRRFARAGFVAARRGPGNALRFSFQDLVLLRAAAGLVQARLRPARVRRALRRLAAQLPEGRSLASVQVAAEGGRVVVRDGGARWHPDTGQVLLDFEIGELARRVAPLVRAAARRGRGMRPLDGEAWFHWGRDLHDVAPAEARTAYRQALGVAPDHAGAHLHLGRLLLRDEGDARAAELHLRRALEDPALRAGAGVALSAALEAQGLLDEALLACARAIEADPALPDAHRAAARLLERLGRAEDARRHLDAARDGD